MQKITICLLNYNGEETIRDTLDSLLNQTYKNFVLHINDNASTDNSVSIIKEYMKKDNRIKLFINEKNVGYCNNIRLAVDRSETDIITIYHNDDIYHPEIIEKSLKIMEENNSIDVVFPNYNFFFDSNKNFKVDFIGVKALKKSKLLIEEKEYYHGTLKEYLPLLLEYGNIFCCPGLMIKKEVYNKSIGFNDDFPTNEDFNLWLDLLCRGYKIAITKEILLSYRINKKQNYYRYKPELNKMYDVLDFHINKIKNENLLEIKDEYINLYNKNKANGYLIAAYNAFFHKNFSLMK